MRSDGFTLVELLIAMVIGLIVTMVMFQALYVSETEARANTGGATAQNKATLALYLLERDIRQAGYGLNGDQRVGCLASALPPTFPEDIVAAPAVVTPDPIAGRPMQVQITYSSSASATAPYHGEPSVPTTATRVVLRSGRFGIAQGDALLLSEPGKPCTLARVVALPDDATDPLSLRTLSISSASGISYSGGGLRVSNLGSMPISNRYRVTPDHRLMVRNVLSPDPEKELATEVFGFVVQYVRDVDNDGVLEYDTVLPANEAAWRRVVAMRVALLLRNEHKERPKPSQAQCSESPTQPTFDGITFDLSTAGDWRCHQFRLFTASIPLRNVAWSPQ